MPKDSLHPHLRIARVGVLFALPAFGVIAALGTAPQAELALPRTALVEPLPINLGEALVEAPASFVREERFQRGDTLSGLLGRLGIGDEDAGELLRSKSPALLGLRAGAIVSAEVSADAALVSLGYLSGSDKWITVRRDGNAFATVESAADVQARVTLKAGTIRSSLFAAADDSGLPDSVAVQLADIFGGDIDFHRDLRKGDRFSAIYETFYLNGRMVRSGRILSAEFVNAGTTHRAVWYAGSDGRGGYYTPEGKNLRKAFLRSPLEFSRVSSGFGMRMHPLVQQWRAHKGIDYAAPAGTRVRAAGHGIVEKIGRQGGYGNVVVLRHQGQYSTVYGHLRGFAPGLRQGSRVSQGDTIGFVGQTGWATGPHLHYEFRIAGQARNPLAIALPSAQPLGTQDLAAFRQHAEPLVTQLDLLTNSSLAALD